MSKKTCWLVLNHYTMTVNKFLIILHFAHSVPSLHFHSFWPFHASCSLPSVVFSFPPFSSLFSLHPVCPVSCGQINISKWPLSSFHSSGWKPLMAVIVHKLVSPCMVCIGVRYVPCQKKQSALFKPLHRITELEFLVGGTQESAN